jgi:hypothetical protein
MPVRPGRPVRRYRKSKNRKQTRARRRKSVRNNKSVRCRKSVRRRKTVKSVRRRRGRMAKRSRRSRRQVGGQVGGSGPSKLVPTPKNSLRSAVSRRDSRLEAAALEAATIQEDDEQAIKILLKSYGCERKRGMCGGSSCSGCSGRPHPQMVENVLYCCSEYPGVTINHQINAYDMNPAAPRKGKRCLLSCCAGRNKDKDTDTRPDRSDSRGSDSGSSGDDGFKSAEEEEEVVPLL